MSGALERAEREKAPERAERSPSLSVRVLFGFLSARGAFGLTYLIGSLRRSPIPWYYPLERRWSFESHPSGLAMEWYGRTASALFFSALAFGAAWFLSARGPLSRALGRPSALGGVARGVGLIVLVDFVYFGWILMHQAHDPLPLPAGALGF
jgi:hypothetical protein